MTENGAPNYPDILGTITGGERFDADFIHMALAVRPRMVRAGSPFEAVLLMQNCTDVRVEVTGKLLLPEADAHGKPGRFMPHSEALSASLRPAEVGYAALPAITLPDTAPGIAYKIGVAVDVQPSGEARRVRDGGQSASGAVYLPPPTGIRLMELKSLAFSTAQRGLFGLVIEAPFGVLPAQVSPVLQPDWVSLWSPDDATDARPLLSRHSRALRQVVLPALREEATFEALYAATEAAIGAAGYAVHPAETGFITRLLMSVLDMAAASAPAFFYPGQEIYHVSRLLEYGWPTDGSPIPLPHWCRALLERLDHHAETADRPLEALTGPLYISLLRDAILHGFHLLYTVAPQELGSEDDKRAYGDQLAEMIGQPDARLSFVDVYLPLALGGIIAAGRTGMLHADDLDATAEIVRRQRAAQPANDTLIFDLIEQVLDWAQSRR